MHTVRFIGEGRVARALGAALCSLGWSIDGYLHRGDDLVGAAFGIDVLIIATPDDVISQVASQIAPLPSTAVVHLSGSLGLEALFPHIRTATLHPLAPLPDEMTGAARLKSGITFAVCGDPIAGEIADALGGRFIQITRDQRTSYHAAATIAANHTVGLLGQVERITCANDLPYSPFVELARFAIDDVSRLGPKGALTGPASRGDYATLASHRDALAPDEVPLYIAGATLAARLAKGSVQTSPMRVVHTGDEFSRILESARSNGSLLGLVPTMGALHLGHKSLIERAAKECDHVAVTIFVNPLQFGSKGDLINYPRTLEADLALCSEVGVATVYVPSVKEMYPNWPEPVATTVSVSGVSAGFEGAERPGHFDGVATVVSKLFSLAGRCRAYFGEKDFQQLAVVKTMAQELSMPIEVISCATVREDDGLALSSRNSRLSEAQRAAASVLSKALFSANELVLGGEQSPHVIEDHMASIVSAEPCCQLDYAAIVNSSDLSVPKIVSFGDAHPYRLLIAASFGEIRLIDNFQVGSIPTNHIDQDTFELVGAMIKESNQ